MVAAADEGVSASALGRTEMVKSLPEKLMLCGWTMRVVGEVAIRSGRMAMGVLRDSRVVILIEGLRL